MPNEITTSSVLARTSARRPAPLEPQGGLVDNRNLTVVVINFPVTASPDRTPAFRPARPVARWLPILPYGALRRKGQGIAAALAFVLLAGSAASWWVLPRSGADEPLDSIRIMLPAPRAEMLARPGVSPVDGPSSPMAVQGAPASRAAVRERASSPRPAAPSSGAGSAALAEIGDLPEVAAATRLALRSGVAQSWQAKGLSGVAVAGPVQLDGTNVCRTVAVLADSGAGGQTVQSVRCMTRAGKWVGREPAGAADAPATVPLAGPSGDQADNGAVR